MRTSLEALNNTLFPVGTVYTTTLTAIPFAFGTWVEIQTPATWGDLEDGNRSYVDGTGAGTLHSFRRTA